MTEAASNITCFFDPSTGIVTNLQQASKLACTSGGKRVVIPSAGKYVTKLEMAIDKELVSRFFGVLILSFFILCRRKRQVVKSRFFCPLASAAPQEGGGAALKASFLPRHSSLSVLYTVFSNASVVLAAAKSSGVNGFVVDCVYRLARKFIQMI